MRIFNASPLILILEEIDEPELINLFSSIDKDLHIPKTVNGEIKSKKARHNLEDLIKNKVVRVCNDCSNEDFEFMKNRFPMLDDGELTVISLAYSLKNPNCKVVIDECLGRNVANQLSLNLTGAFGLLLELYKSKKIDLDRLKVTCRKIDKSSFRINFKEIGYEWVIK